MAPTTDNQTCCGQQQGPKRLPGKLSAASFYDLESLKGQKRQRVAPQELLPGKQAPTTGTPLFNPLHAPFKAFKTQRAAFEFLDKQTCSPILRTFARETAETGQRDFIVTSAELFWQHYIQLPLQKRHHYEIVREGRPCHLYFDLEFYPAFNPDIDGPGLVEALLSGVQQELQDLFSIPWDPGFVLELDSSTASKFSRHLIFQLPGLAFANTCHAGRFARRVLLRLLQRGLHCSKYAQLLVLNQDRGVTAFVDMGVYTRNRAFRLYLSSKFGKTAVLRLTHRFRGAATCPKAAFHGSLVSVLQPPAAASTRGSGDSATSGSCKQRRHLVSLLRVEDDGQDELLKLPDAWQQLASIQLRPLEHSQHDTQPPLATAAAAVSAYCSSNPHVHSHQHGGGLAQMTFPLGLLQGSSQPCLGPSPFPQLDHFIASVCCAGGVQGGIRSWLLQPGSACVLYNIKNNRWCGNIGRAHKSNGIYFCVDLAAGVYFQKCYDPECRHYRSNYMPLPADVWQAYRHLLIPPTGQAQQRQSTGMAASSSLLLQCPGPVGGCPTLQARQLPGQQHPPTALATPAAGCGWVCPQQDEGLAAASLDAESEEDEECLQMLLQFEHQQQQQQQYTPGAALPPGAHTHPEQLQVLAQQQEHAAGSSAAAWPTIAADDDF